MVIRITHSKDGGDGLGDGYDTLTGIPNALANAEQVQDSDAIVIEQIGETSAAALPPGWIDLFLGQSLIFEG